MIPLSRFREVLGDRAPVSDAELIEVRAQLYAFGHFIVEAARQESLRKIILGHAHARPLPTEEPYEH